MSYPVKLQPLFPIALNETPFKNRSLAVQTIKCLALVRIRACFDAQEKPQKSVPLPKNATKCPVLGAFHGPQGQHRR